MNYIPKGGLAEAKRASAHEIKFLFRSPHFLFLLAFLVGMAVWLGSAWAQTPANSSTTTPNPKSTIASQDLSPDLSGFWERRDDSGSGSFGGLGQRTPPAEITPEAKQFAAQQRARQEAGYVISFASRYCQYLGMPFIMGQSPPIDIVQGKDEILIMSEQSSAPRHIYTDGRRHPDPSTYEPTTNGHSIGQWEGDTLVVDTIGFNEFGQQVIPGGGMRTKTSHLVERFHLLDGGKRLSITYTWTDPKVYLKPHTYEIVYYKEPPGTYAFEDLCDAGDPAQGRSVVPPPQN
jgi:hypothetical protein